MTSTQTEDGGFGSSCQGCQSGLSVWVISMAGTGNEPRLTNKWMDATRDKEYLRQVEVDLHTRDLFSCQWARHSHSPASVTTVEQSTVTEQPSNSLHSPLRWLVVELLLLLVYLVLLDNFTVSGSLPLPFDLRQKTYRVSLPSAQKRTNTIVADPTVRVSLLLILLSVSCLWVCQCCTSSRFDVTVSVDLRSFYLLTNVQLYNSTVLPTKMCCLIVSHAL